MLIHKTTRGRRARPAARAILVLLLGAGLLAVQPLAASAAATSGVVNINTASSDELQMLPGIGKARADAIVELRKQRGAFKSVDELTSVKGIGDSMLERLRPHVSLTGKTTARSSDGPPASR